MSYVLELSGVVSYIDNTEAAFLAVDDIKDDIIIQDPQAFGDADRTLKALAIAAGGELALPRTTLETGKTVRKTTAKISCWYTVGQQSYEFSVVSSEATGLEVFGDGSLSHFMNNYETGANSFINRVIRGATLRGVTPVEPVLMFIRNDVLTTFEVIVALYEQTSANVYELITEKLIDLNNEGAIIFDRSGFSSPHVHVRFPGSPPPPPANINTQVGLLGILQVDLTVSLGLNVSLTNGVLA